jgi:DNA-binding NarL/FixJ family response regulator
MRTGSVQHGSKRVMLVDDHTMVRRGLRALIESAPGWEVCAEAADGHDALAIAEAAQPDIIVMDLSMPRLGGIDATVSLRKFLPNVEILILTMHESDELADQALRAGALGYLLKGDSGEKLMEALQALSRHQPYHPAGLRRGSDKSSRRTADGSDRRRLTPRERQIVKLVAEGNTNHGIASLLGVSIKTVQTHRLAAMRKVGAKSSADLTLYAARNDLVQL